MQVAWSHLRRKKFDRSADSSGSGEVNIPQNAMNYVVKTAVVASMTGQGGAERPELKGLTVPVRVSGPFGALKYKVEFSRMVRGVSKEQLEAAKEAGREALKEAARDKLQDLLGGRDKKSGDADSGAPCAFAHGFGESMR